MIQILILAGLCLLVVLGSQWLRSGTSFCLRKAGFGHVDGEPSNFSEFALAPPASMGKDEAPAAAGSDCICNQCEMAPACSRRFPQCVQG